MKNPCLTPEQTIAGEIEALENALNNKEDRECYEEDFWHNADVLLRAMKALQKGEIKHERISKAS